MADLLADILSRNRPADVAASVQHRRPVRVTWNRDPEGDPVVGWPASTVSDAEIAELVCGSLEDAISAAEKPCPETFLDVLLCQKRERMAEKLKILPRRQAAHPLVQAELAKSVAFISEQAALSKAIVQSIRRYGRKKGRSSSVLMS